MATLLFNKFLITFLTLIIPLVLSEPNQWSYSSQSDWPKLCKVGRAQTPIDVKTRTALLNTTLFIDYKHYDKDIKNFMITNNGHTAKLSLDNTEDTSQDLPYITGIALDNQDYKFAQLHFHWSQDRGRGSEHLINGKQYSMEMHIVHYNSKYDNISNAINHRDGLAVIGVLFEITRKENPHLDAIIQGIQQVKIEGGDYYRNQLIPRQDEYIPTVRLDQLLPNDITQFFRYHGSLTTPPCSEAVTWLLFQDTTDIGLKQIQSFRELMNSNKVVLSDTFRQLQTLNDRKVETSKQVPDVRDGSGVLSANLVFTHLSILASLLVFAKN